jgi:ATP-dependent RNA helicase DDX10/DBP4
MPHGEIFQVDDLPLLDYATSLGLQSAPNLQFLKKTKTRTELRETKNVNHKLNKLKQQIKAEKLAKKLQRLGSTTTTSDGDRKEAATSNRDDDDENEDLLVVKTRHDWRETSADSLPDAGIHEVTMSRKAKRIRIDGPNQKVNTHIVFNDDGDEENEAATWKQTTLVNNADDDQRELLESANEAYLSQIRKRLENNMEQDRAQQQERIREKHKKVRLRDKVDREDTSDFGNAAFGDEDVEEAAEEDDSEEDDSSSTHGSHDGSDGVTESDDESAVDVEEEEERALSLIRNIS